MRDFTDKYLPDDTEYENPTDRMFPLGTRYEYVSSSLLDGFINYVTIKSAFLITRYSAHDDNKVDAEKFNEAKHAHTKICDLLDDDVLILAKAGKDRSDACPNQWWFFWYDCDVSDCVIGRFETGDKDEDVVAAFAKYAEARSRDLSRAYGENEDPCPAIALDQNAFKGWIYRS